jgi:S-adenosylmethionine:tRNA ribosyltransferase-isomerase
MCQVPGPGHASSEPPVPGSRVSDYHYELPPGRIARYPARDRDESRLLVVDRGGSPIRHLRFRDLVHLVPPGDLLVVNESRVLPARLLGRKPTGAPSEILLLRPVGESEVPGAGIVGAGASGGGMEAGAGRGAFAPSASPGRGYGSSGGGMEAVAGRGASAPSASPGRGSGSSTGDGKLWEALVRPGGKLKPGRRVEVAPELEVEILDSTPEGGRIVRLVTDLTGEEAIHRFGHMPLPPYLEREDEPLDRERYQTVYATDPGSVAAPTAGLHFTDPLLDELALRGVGLARVTLHVGVGTFRPVESEDPANHRMHTEVYRVPREAAEAMNRCRATGGKVWAVGTTVVRTLESAAGEDGRVRPGAGATHLFIHPPYRFRAVDRLITNFHLPRSTLLMLVAAFAGYQETMEAYRAAMAGEYRFYSYGDAMAIL